jgi:ATP phosphoribosyltransferase
MSGEDTERMDAILEERERVRQADPTNRQLAESFHQQLEKGLLALALPNGKGTKEQVDGLLELARLKQSRTHPRSVVAALKGLPPISRTIGFKPNQVTEAVVTGAAALGITGEDCVLEYDGGDATKPPFERIEICAVLPYSRRTFGPTKAVLFARADDPVRSIEDIRPDQRVATEYPNETKKKLAACGVRATIVTCTGSAESLVVAGQCDFGVALTETGDTLRANGLKVIGEVFTSNMVLIGNKAALDIPAIRESAMFLARKLKGVLSARERVYLLMNAPATKVDDICDYLRGHGATMRDPTVAPLLNGSMYCSVSTVVWAADLNEVEWSLMRFGADGFVELDAQCVM